MALLDFTETRHAVEALRSETKTNQESVNFCLAFLDYFAKQEFDEGVGPPQVVQRYGREVRLVWTHAAQTNCSLWLTFYGDWEIQQYWQWPGGDAVGGWVRMTPNGSSPSGCRLSLALLFKNVNVYGQQNPVGPLVKTEL